MPVRHRLAQQGHVRFQWAMIERKVSPGQRGAGQAEVNKCAFVHGLI